MAKQIKKIKQYNTKDNKENYKDLATQTPNIDIFVTCITLLLTKQKNQGISE